MLFMIAGNENSNFLQSDSERMSTNETTESFKAPTVNNKVGRPKLIFQTIAERKDHLKNKKDKNRLCAARLRIKKKRESASLNKVLKELEENVKRKRAFLEILKKNVDKLKIKILSIENQNMNLLNE